MEWETPSFIDIDMSAEIGAYQDEQQPPAPWPSFAEPESDTDDEA